MVLLSDTYLCSARLSFLSFFPFTMMHKKAFKWQRHKGYNTTTLNPKWAAQSLLFESVLSGLHLRTVSSASPWGLLQTLDETDRVAVCTWPDPVVAHHWSLPDATSGRRSHLRVETSWGNEVKVETKRQSWFGPAFDDQNLTQTLIYLQTGWFGTWQPKLGKLP